MKKPLKNALILASLVCFLAFPRFGYTNPSELIDTLMVESASTDDLEFGFILQDLKSGKVVYSKNAELLLNPASNTKVLTALAALKLLGADYTFKTQLFALPNSEPSHLHALTLKGYGDPSFNSVQLLAMIHQLKEKGIKKIDQLFVDGSYFDGETFPGQFDGRQKDAHFNCSVGALSIDHNLLEVIVSPEEKVGKEAIVEINPPLSLLSINDKVVTGGKKGRVIVKNKSDEEGDLGISVLGSISPKSAPQSFKLSIHQPAKLAALRFLQALKDEGIQVPDHVDVGPAPFGSLPLIEANSPPLLAILQEMNKQSDNFIAEQLTKYLGAKFGGSPGSTSKGTDVILKKLKEMGVNTQGANLENGSGLSRLNRISPHMLSEVLYKAYKDSKLQENFLSTLSIMGVDGTMRRKFRNSDIAGRFIGKTGTLNGVTSLSGYLYPLRSEDKQPSYIYAYIMNGKGKDFWKQKKLFQDILELLLNT